LHCALRPPQCEDELADTFVSLQREKRVDGLFLSSGIVPDADTTLEKMLATIERLRLREGYTGYIHHAPRNLGVGHERGLFGIHVGCECVSSSCHRDALFFANP
jgi:hypothetical protein